jgi:hypothetical protein
MLARVGGGKSGIGKYLESGRKKGRENGRDEIDDRMVLEGDIAKLESVIASYAGHSEDSKADRYVHITLGFAEQFTAASVCGSGEVNFALMKAVADAYRELLMAAYGPDEYYWYAEAHIPKVTHDVHAVTGEAIERLPHIHIVYPKINLTDRTYLNPANTGGRNERYLQAIQETINARFGLKSPQDSLRAAAESPLARHSIAFDKLSATQIRQRLREGVESGRIPTFDKLIQESERYGAVRVRQGREGDYINITPEGAPKGMNVKEFTRQGFGLQAVQASSGESRAVQFATVAREWVDRGAHESRYAVGGFHAHYQALAGHEKVAWLQDRISRTQTRLEAIRSDEAFEPITYREPIHEPEHSERKRASHRAVAELYESNFLKSERLLQTRAIDGVQHLSSVGVVHDLRRSEVLLYDDAPDHMGETTAWGSALRRQRSRVGREGGDRSDEGAALGRMNGSIGQHGSRRTVSTTLEAQHRPGGPTPAQLKGDTNPLLVLEKAVLLYKIDIARYSVTSGHDGTPRILHADKQYNLGDFFTKHLDVPWAQAQKVLTQCYYQTLAEGLPVPEPSLWQGFRAWEKTRPPDTGPTRAAEEAIYRAELKSIRDAFKATRSAVQAMPPAPRGRPTSGVPVDLRLRKSSLMAQARAQQIVKIAAAERRFESASQGIQRRPSRKALYRHYLTELAGRGNTNALKELRRSAAPAPDMAQTITGAISRPVFAQPHYAVDHTGTVSYFRNAASALGRVAALVTDSTKGVSVLRVDPAAYAIALKVAVARYGPNLTLTGDAVFLKGMADAARSQKVSVTFRNSAAPQAKPVVLDGTTPDIRGR